MEATISPLFFSRRHLKTGDIVWPAEISGLLQEKSYGGNWKKKSTPTDEVRESGTSGKDTVITDNCFPSLSEESKPVSEIKEVNKGSEVKENLTCACRQEIDRLPERIKGLCFQTLTSDCTVTGLPDCNTFATMYNFLRPLRSFNGASSVVN